MTDTSITVGGTGPLLTGKDAQYVNSFLLEAQQEVAQQAFANVHMELDKNIKHPTPYYETQIINQRVANTQVIHDRGIIYGPWLEGTAPANNRSSFKGYHSFRKAQQQTEREMGTIVLHIMKKYLGKM